MYMEKPEASLTNLYIKDFGLVLLDIQCRRRLTGEVKATGCTESEL